MDRDGLRYSHICKGKRFTYSVCEDGAVIKCSLKRYVESRITPYLKRGHATVTINGRTFTLKNLVAKHFVKGYRVGDFVECIDGNPFNCKVANLRIYTHSEHGKRTGWQSRSQAVVVGDVEYRSVREAAKALHVSYQTLLDYMGGKVKHSVIRDIPIFKNMVEGTDA